MANTNVFPLTETLDGIQRGAQFVDFAGLDYFWGLAKAYTDKYADDKVAAETAARTTSEAAITKSVSDLSAVVDALKGTGEGSVADQISAAKEELKAYADTAEADALAAAKTYADGLKTTIDGVIAENERVTSEALTDLDGRVVVLEAIDHDKLASDAAAAAVATVLDGAPEKFDTLKEIAKWIEDTETADSAADLVTRVSTLETTVGKEAEGENPATGLVKTVADMDAAYKAADVTLQGNINTLSGTVEANKTAIEKTVSDLEASLKKYADDAVAVEAGNRETADNALSAAIAALEAKLYGVEGVEGDLAKLEADLKKYAEDEADAAESAAKAYTDELFASIKFVTKEQIDGLFAVSAE